MDTPKINRFVWFCTPYDGPVKGIIESEDKDYYRVLLTYGYQFCPKEDCYFTEESCLKAQAAKIKKKIKDYKESINSTEDLINFMLNNTVSFAEEYTDWEAREAAIQKAEELGFTVKE